MWGPPSCMRADDDRPGGLAHRLGGRPYARHAPASRARLGHGAAGKAVRSGGSIRATRVRLRWPSRSQRQCLIRGRSGIRRKAHTACVATDCRPRRKAITRSGGSLWAVSDVSTAPMARGRRARVAVAQPVVPQSSTTLAGGSSQPARSRGWSDPVVYDGHRPLARQVQGFAPTGSSLARAIGPVRLERGQCQELGQTAIDRS